MATFVLSFLLLLLAVTGLAAGVLLGRQPISGSCGGLGSSACAACTRPCDRPRHREGDGPRGAVAHAPGCENSPATRGEA